MLAFIIRRSLQAVLVLLLMSVLVFIGVYVVGNPVDILVNPQADPQARELSIAALGLGGPRWAQYLAFLSGVFHGDLGSSFVHKLPALRLVLERLPATFELAIVAMLLAIIVGVPLGLWAGLKPGTATGRTIQAASIIGWSLPTFWAGLLLIMVFAVLLRWLPAMGRGPTTLLFGVPVSFLSLQGWRYLLLPASSLALFALAALICLGRGGTREAMLQNYVKFARAKGIPNARVIRVHALRNVFPSLVAAIGLQFGSVLAFTIVTETVFGWPGAGKLFIDSINLLDRPTIVAYVLVMLFVIIVINLITDILYSALDPRVRLREGKE